MKPPYRLWLLPLIIPSLPCPATLADPSGYSIREEVIPHGDIALFARIYVPEGPGPHAAVVLVHGSKNHRGDFYEGYAETFAECGVVAAVYDKRGHGRSTGDLWTSDFADLAGDALAVVGHLQSLPTVNPFRTGLWGDSQAGWILLIAEQRKKDLAFLISKAGPAVTPLEQTLHDIEHNYLKRENAPEEVITDLMLWYPRVLEYLVRERDEARWATIRGGIGRYGDTPWLKHDFDRYYRSLLQPPDFMPPIEEIPLDPSGRDFDFDPFPFLQRLSTPTLVLYGTADPLVPEAMGISVVESIDNPHLILEIYEEADHGMRVTRWPSWLRRPVFAEGYLELLCDFIEHPRSFVDE